VVLYYRKGPHRCSRHDLGEGSQARYKLVYRGTGGEVRLSAHEEGYGIWNFEHPVHLSG